MQDTCASEEFLKNIIRFCEMKFKEKIKELFVNILALTFIGVFYYFYDTWTPSDKFASGWRAGLFETILKFLHEKKLGVFIGKGTLITLFTYYFYKIFIIFKIKKK